LTITDELTAALDRLDQEILTRRRSTNAMPPHQPTTPIPMEETVRHHRSWPSSNRHHLLNESASRRFCCKARAWASTRSSSAGGHPVTPHRRPRWTRHTGERLRSRLRASSIAEAVATWLETATAVEVRLNRTDDIEVCAPLGLADLLGGCGGEILARPVCQFPCSAWPGTTPRSAGRAYGSFCDYGNHGGQHRDP